MLRLRARDASARHARNALGFAYRFRVRARDFVARPDAADFFREVRGEPRADERLFDVFRRDDGADFDRRVRDRLDELPFGSRPKRIRSSFFACSSVRFCFAERFLPPRLMKKLSIDIADRNGSALRRVLCSAERLSESAIALGSLFVKTPSSRSSASLCSITSCDHFLVAMPTVYPPGVMLRYRSTAEVSRP
jgi:hypothetical protein